MRREWELREHRRTDKEFKWNGFIIKGDSWYGFDWYNNPMVITNKITNGMVLTFIADGNHWIDKYISIENPCIPFYISVSNYMFWIILKEDQFRIIYISYEIK